MKFLILCTILPCLVFGTTESWDKDEETFTLKESDPTLSSPPVKHGGGLVKISLSTSPPPFLDASPPRPSHSTTTEDPILPLILRKLIEQSINNEIKQDKNNNEKPSRSASVSVSNKTPLVYMTPPPPLPVSSSTTQSSSSLEEDEDDISSTTTENGFSSTTTDSGEIDDFDSSSTTTPKIPKMIGAERKEEDVKEPSPLKGKQYAENYQSYLPQPAEEGRDQHEEQEGNAAIVPQEPEDEPEDDEQDSKDPVQSQPPPPSSYSHHLDRVEFPEREESREEEDMKDESQTSSTTETISETPEQQDENVPPPSDATTTESDQRQRRPIYYFFLRPKQNSQYRIPVSSGMMMIPPQSPSIRSYSYYPQQVQAQPQMQIQQQQRFMTFPNQMNYKFPSFIAQDYDNQMTYSSPIQQQQRPQVYYPFNNVPNYYRSASNYPNPYMINNYYPQEQQQQQYLPMASNLYPQQNQQQYLLQQNSYMRQNPSIMMNQMYPYSSPYMPTIRPIYRSSFNNNNYRVPFYQANNPDATPSSSQYTLNYDANNNYPSFGYNNNYNGMTPFMSSNHL